MRITTTTPEQTLDLGSTIGAAIEAGITILLYGPLGAGKTVLAKGIAAGLEVPDTITSPTFALIREYEGRLPLLHVDLYRLESPEQFDDLGLDDRLDGSAVLLIEWPERADGFLPPDAARITIEVNHDSSRTVAVDSSISPG